MKITILTLFPDMFRGPFDASIIKRAQEKNRIEIQYVNLRDFGIGKHKLVDDTPYGGGIGMVMRVDVIHAALKSVLCAKENGCREHIVLLTASGTPFTQKKAEKFAGIDHLILICGHYEGIDERITHFIDEELSIGDFVVTGGEIPAMLITDAVARLIPGVLTAGATERESFSFQPSDARFLEYPQYTRPEKYEELSVPPVLLSGNHKKIEEWRVQEAEKKTKKVRPDMLNQ